MSIKSKLALQLVAASYVLIIIFLYKLNLLQPVTIFILCVLEFITWSIIFFNEKLSGITDELVLSILSKVNKIGMNFLVISIVILSIILIAPLYKDFVISKVAIGICLMLILFIFSIIRLLSFIYYDRKGICK
ncbi:hypothetical protein LGL55_22670 [Clostridium tagluense]|uniref:hypothetical protein n=1 Tax=Clostridium TaxID=1485 RepID=UPI0013E939AC|nr:MULTISPECIES: hypothetical protein [Clostridium]MBU3130500.1 hypothetical protein [Clostridium tagluense]MBZ9626187.1 hypothetical protein [Clostridium sp. FP2]MCB2311862.1 hypothetical protein [Clostridium tagluense]MCB2317383.1 hypothetical protein [Clostridium tagluense]MCB2323734.1 hypothetical protein [Clostridium tagluense]